MGCLCGQCIGLVVAELRRLLESIEEKRERWHFALSWWLFDQVEHLRQHQLGYLVKRAIAYLGHHVVDALGDSFGNAGTADWMSSGHVLRHYGPQRGILSQNCSRIAILD